MRENEPSRHYKDPSFLTPYEQEIYELSQRGLSYKEISEAMGGRSAPRTIQTRMKIVREKVVLKEIMDAQDRRISWP